MSVSEPRPRLAASPVSWGVDFPDHPSNPAFTTVLDEAAAAGLGALELGPYGYFPSDAGRLRELLQERGLRAVGTFLVEPLHDPRAREESARHAVMVSDAIAAVGADVLVVIDEVSAERTRTAGAGRIARRLDAGEWTSFIESVRRVAEVASDRGLTPVFHPHAGTYVEFEDEIERFAHGVPGDEIGMCLDSGHCAYAGIDPVAAFERYAPVLKHVHLKDVDPGVRRRALERQLGFWEASAASIFCRLGEGVVDFAALARVLARAKGVRWATVEQDRDPSAAGQDPLDDLGRSIDHLRVLGYAA